MRYPDPDNEADRGRERSAVIRDNMMYHLEQHGPMPSTQLCDLVGVSAQTITMTADRWQRYFVIEHDTRHRGSKHGKRPTRIARHPQLVAYDRVAS